MLTQFPLEDIQVSGGDQPKQAYIHFTNLKGQS